MTSLPIEDKIFSMLRLYSEPKHAVTSLILTLCHVYNESNKEMSIEDFANAVRDSIIEALQ